jgi:hypothetical protein
VCSSDLGASDLVLSLSRHEVGGAAAGLSEQGVT